MPVISNSTYNPLLLFRNKHINTVAPTLFRKIIDIKYERKRITTPDHDFLDLDFSFVQSRTIVIVIHGLEGFSGRAYMKGMVRAANQAGWDGLAINLRNCSGEPNLLYSSYHSGKSDDLDFVINYLISNYNYSRIMIVGFSLGGNLTLKYAGEMANKISPLVKAVAGVSVPCSLKDSSNMLAKRSNYIYMYRFMRTMKRKLLYKKSKHPDVNLSIEEIKKMKNFYDFDYKYTAPAHGFKDAEEYWEKCSCNQFLPRITIPALLINSLDDPFLGQLCYPYEEAEKSNFLYFETPQHGGHTGFTTGYKFEGNFWHENRIIQFFKEHITES
jgi:uncharacterized protein